MRMRYVRLRDILWQKSTSRARELVGNYSYRTSSKSVGNLSQRLARKYFYGESVGKSCRTNPVAFLHKVVFLIDRGTCSCLARTTRRFSLRVSGGGHWGSFERLNYLGKYRNIKKKSPNIATRQSAESKLDVIPQSLLCMSSLQQITRKQQSEICNF